MKRPDKPRRTRDVLLRGGTLVTCDDRDRVLRGDLLLRAGRIAAMGKVKAPRGVHTVDVRDCIVLPGFVMAHVHLCQTLMRGMADDLPLLSWLRRRIWPLEAAHDARTMRASAELGLSELVSGGATTLLDLGTVFEQDEVFDACVRTGVRVVGGKTLMDSGQGVPRRLKESTARALSDAERLERTWSEHPSGRVHYAWIPRFILSCSEKLVRGALQRASTASAVFHTHAAEHPGERAAVRKALGADDVDVLLRWGMQGPRASIAHGVQLTKAQMRRLARADVGVVHCPSANLKLGSGIARVAQLRAQGVTVGLGPDGAPCNNNLDPFVELRQAALLSSGVADPGALAARNALRLATIDGARLLGLADGIGSLELGKLADVTVVRQRAVHCAPGWDAIGTLVYAAQSRDVQHVLVGGRFVVKNAELLTVERERVVATAQRQGRRLWRRAGL